MNSLKNENSELENVSSEDLEIDGGPILTPSPKDQRILTLLFAIRTSVLEGQKKIEEIRRNQEQSDIKVDEVCKKVDKVHEKLLEPDRGLFARVRDLEAKSASAIQKEKELETSLKHVDQLVDWKSAFSKIWWYVGFTAGGILLKYIFDTYVTKK